MIFCAEKEYPASEKRKLVSMAKELYVALQLKALGIAAPINSKNLGR